ncbi:MAG: GntR family transcriptional regulator [Roseateles sp.]|uniref:GntR family transcriptional regulator n=1 Tax=Roseateles sp. TaxID=1971397 RepID=UPI0039ED6893
MTPPPDLYRLLRDELAQDALGAADAAGPLYLRLASQLRQAVLDGRLRPGASLPPERELAQRLGISRQTVRKAVEALTNEGALKVRQGSGTFVSARLVESLTELTSFSDDMRRRGLEPGSLWLDREIGPPDAQEALALGLPLHGRVARLSRVRLADGEPIALEFAVVDAALVGGTTEFGSSLYEAIRAQGRAPVRAVQRVRAAIAGDRAARALDIALGSPVLQIERHSYDAAGRPLEWTRSTYRGDMYDYVVEMRASPPA